MQYFDKVNYLLMQNREFSQTFYRHDPDKDIIVTLN